MYGYYCVSSKTVNYYLDPRNFLIESSIFQFLDLRNNLVLEKEIISEIVSGTYLSNYVDTIIEASQQADVNPLHIISTIYQELGKKATIPKAISGTIPGYEGLYNFYNIGATDGVGAVERGMIKARQMGWTTPEFALIDGAVKVLKEGYIYKGQLTKYFYKFDVVGNEIVNDNETKTYSTDNFYKHQYMTNIQDPLSQSGNLMQYYTNYGKLNSDLVFVIPVYENMPQNAVSFPTTLTQEDGELYYVNTIHVTNLRVRDENGNEIGKLTKGQLVAVQKIENNVATLKLKVATGISPDETGKNKWNYEEKIVVLSDASYLIKYEEPKVEDNTNNENLENNLPLVSTEEFKIEETNIKMIPSVSVNKIKEVYPNAVIIKNDGTDITATEEQVGTGYKITIDGIEYMAIKYGDINGDGKVKASDYVLIKNYIMEEQSNFSEQQKTAADINKDGNIKASDYVLIKNYIMDGSKIGL